MTLPRFQPGQPASVLLNSRTLNELARGVEAQRAGIAAPLPQWSQTVRVRNDTGSPLNIYSPVGVGDCLSDVVGSWDGELPPLLFRSIEPSDERLWGISQEAIDVDAVGDVLIWGPTWVRMESSLPSFHPFAKLSTADRMTWSGTLNDGRFEVMHTAYAGESGYYAAGVLLPPVSRGICVPRYELRHWWRPSGGHSQISVLFNSVSEIIDIPYEANEATIAAAIDAHSEFVAAGAHCSVEMLSGGLTRTSAIISLPLGATLDWHADSSLVADTSTDAVPFLTVVPCSCT